MNTGNWQRDLHRIALYMTGLVFAAIAVPRLAMETVGWLLGPASGNVKGYSPHMRYLWLVLEAVQFIVGLHIVRRSALWAGRAFPQMGEPREPLPPGQSDK